MKSSTGFVWPATMFLNNRGALEKPQTALHVKRYNTHCVRRSTTTKCAWAQEYHSNQSNQNPTSNTSTNEVNDKVRSKLTVTEDDKIDAHLDDLQKALDRAVRSEKFGDAARIRDQLNTLRVQADKTEVLAANRAYYDAFNNASMSQMKEVWSHDDYVSALHPFLNMLKGFDAVMESWEKIFRGNRDKKLRVSTSQIRVRSGASMAIVMCVETLTATKNGQRLTAGRVSSTNIFRRNSNGKWKMVHHHASVVMNSQKNFSA